jgi:catechol 2,3-dioxygenase-like lactoylglutathione lyase family enzyme
MVGSNTRQQAPWLHRSLHAGLATRDLDASLAFYCSAFGYVVVFRDDDLKDMVARLTDSPGLAVRLAQIRRPGEAMVELLEFRPVDLPADAPPRACGDGHTPMGHLAFAVSDIDKALVDLRAAGARPMGDIVMFPEGRCVYCREPGGTVFELEEVALVAPR